MPAPPVDREIGAFLEAIPLSLGHLDVASLPRIRADRELLVSMFELSDRVEREDVVVPGPPGSPEVTVRVHRPKGFAGPLPALYSIHGGGYVLGHRSMDDARMDQWAPELGFVGFSVEYRLAPETPYPGPLEDCYAGLQWVFQNAADLGIDPDRIGIAGASAGGGLAAGLAILARDRAEMHPAFQLLAYPMIDDRQATGSSQWDVPVWNPSQNEFGWRSYLGDLYGADSVPSTAAPGRPGDLSDLPPALIFVGTVDGFCDEDTAYATRLWNAGVETDLHVYAGAPHGFDAIMPSAAVSERCLTDVRKWLRRAMA